MCSSAAFFLFFAAQKELYLFSKPLNYSIFTASISLGLSQFYAKKPQNTEGSLFLKLGIKN